MCRGVQASSPDLSCTVPIVLQAGENECTACTLSLDVHFTVCVPFSRDQACTVFQLPSMQLSQGFCMFVATIPPINECTMSFLLPSHVCPCCRTEALGR